MTGHTARSFHKAVRQYLKDKGVYQEFSHVASPQDNAYIEALHSNLQREVIDRFEFESIYHAQMVIDQMLQRKKKTRILETSDTQIRMEKI